MLSAAIAAAAAAAAAVAAADGLVMTDLRNPKIGPNALW